MILKIGTRGSKPALARLTGDKVYLEGMEAELDGSKVIRDKITGEKDLA